MASRASYVVDAALSEAGNSRNRCAGGASSMISRIRVSSMASLAVGTDGMAGRFRWAAEVGTMGIPCGVFQQKHYVTLFALGEPPIVPRPLLHCIGPLLHGIGPN